MCNCKQKFLMNSGYSLAFASVLSETSKSISLPDSSQEIRGVSRKGADPPAAKRIGHLRPRRCLFFNTPPPFNHILTTKVLPYTVVYLSPIIALKGDPILGAFLHKILGKVLLMNSLDVSTLFVNQNMSYL